MNSPGSHSDATSYAEALREMTLRYEALISEVAILRQLDEFTDPTIQFADLCRRLILTLASDLTIENCSLFLLDTHGKNLETRATASPMEPQGVYYGEGEWTGKRFRLGEGVLGKAAQTGEATCIHDVRDHPDFVALKNSPVEFRSLACFPIRVQGRVIGVLNFSHAEPGYFTRDLSRSLEVVAERVGHLLTGHFLNQQLRVSEEHHRLIATTAADAIVVFDVSGRVVSANPSAETITGIPPSLFLTGEEEWLAGIVAEDQEPFLQHCRRVRTSSANETVEYRRSHRDGQIHHLEQRSAALHDAAGQCTGIVATIRDASERKRAEREKQELEAQVRQLQKMEAVGQLAGGIAHNFNNLLTGILGNLDFADTLSDLAEIRPLLREATLAGERAAVLVKQLLSFSRKSQVSLLPVDLQDVLVEVISIIRKTFDRRIEIFLKWSPSLHPVMGDSGQLHQVFLNLCLNARDAIDQLDLVNGTAPPQLIIRAEEAVIDEGFWQAHPEVDRCEYMCVSVTDTGVGMTEDVQKHLFEPFFTTKELGKGTGLGLASVYGIIRQHRGWITVYSRPEEGTTFKVYLPVTAEAAPARVEHTHEALPRGSETVLLVDDEDMLRRLGTAFLTTLGYTVLTAANGAEGLKLFFRDRERISVVILDIWMPGLSGYEVMREIRAVDDRVRIILSSGNRMTGTEPPPAEAEGLPLLDKPYTLPAMAATLRHALDGHAAP